MAEWKELQLKEDKYTDANAVAAVASADDYVKNDGDTITGKLIMTHENTYADGAFLASGQDSVFKITDTGTWGGFWVIDKNDKKVFWFGASQSSGKGQVEYYTYDVNDQTDHLTQLVAYTKIVNYVYTYLDQIRSGSTQANAGASAKEIWKTSGHASLPDNVLMIGV
jgi:hypothetical protein